MKFNQQRQACHIQQEALRGRLAAPLAPFHQTQGIVKGHIVHRKYVHLNQLTKHERVHAHVLFLRARVHDRLLLPSAPCVVIIMQ